MLSSGKALPCLALIRSLMNMPIWVMNSIFAAFTLLLWFVMFGSVHYICSCKCQKKKIMLLVYTVLIEIKEIIEY